MISTLRLLQSMNPQSFSDEMRFKRGTFLRTRRDHPLSVRAGDFWNRSDRSETIIAANATVQRKFLMTSIIEIRTSRPTLGPILSVPYGA